MSRRVFTTLFFVSAALCFCSITSADERTKILFSRDVLPVLSENCFFCHGPDEEQRKADLRLDTEDGVTAAIDRAALDQSELLRRVISDDPDEMMPPPDSNRKLTAEQRSTLGQWIAQGAQWGRHWSFEPLITPQVPEPAFANFPVHNPIDAFVQQKLLQKGLRPSPEAASQTLLRRISLDLTGLPPAPEEVNAFPAIASDVAYEQAVDRLLASPAFGERMAWDWLNAARYADSNGYQGDRERTMWPWRDWVVDAFNRNMPFDQFTTLQLAGDLLPDATAEQKLATGFCRNHMINGEGGRIAEENRVDYVMDMSETMGTVWLGLTLNCCRCHDHKYDPLTQNEYYQFFAFFNQTPVTGGGGDPQTAPVLPVISTEQKQRLSDIQQQLTKLNPAITARIASRQPLQQAWEVKLLAKEQTPDWQVLAPKKATAQHQQLTKLDDFSILAEGTNARNDTYTIEYSPSIGTLTGLRLEALRHESMTKGGLARSDSGNFVLTEVEFLLKDPDRETKLTVASAVATFEQGSLKIATAFDGNNATGWAVYDGKPLDRDHAAAFRFEKSIEVPQGAILQVVLRHDSQHAFHNLGRFRMSVTSVANPELTSSNETLLADLRTLPADRSKEQQTRIRDAFLNDDAEYGKLAQRKKILDKQRDDINAAAAKVMIMTDQTEWRPTFVLNRGLYNDVTQHEVTTATPASLPAMPSAESHSNRLDLARWLLSDQHPLTARVTVNRFWQQIFGAGLVKTTEDFGVQAEYPEYKDLLDWLAADFQSNGWDIKRLMKTILMSHTYRQSSAAGRALTTDRDGNGQTLAEFDPENRLLARASRFRLPSWMLRDQALAVSGLLNDRIGGPPVNTYQPAGVWEEATFGKKTYKQDSGENLYRRSLYIFWRRIIAPTMFFDNASRQSCTVKALRTNTPLHTLLTLNETTYVEAARALAQTLLSGTMSATDQERVEQAFLRVLGRLPSREESAVFMNGIERSIAEYAANVSVAEELLSVGESVRDDTIDPARHAGWTSGCLTLLNLDETLNRE